MNHHPMKLCFERDIKLFSVLLYPVNTNENIAFYFSFGLGIIKSNNVSVSVMVEVFFVEAKQILIRAKNIVHFIYGGLLPGSAGDYPGL
jgi:hypothetical protein